MSAPDPQSQPTTGSSSSAEEVKERVAESGEQANLGAGEEEPDPATAEDPPSDISAGEEKRDPGVGSK